jgi:SAM-dependent methyltransferase
MMHDARACVVCGSAAAPVREPVLWPQLVADWGLSAAEAESVDRREGQRCADCGVSLRSAALALAILRRVGWVGTLESWISSVPQLSLLEINLAGQLTPWLQRLRHHQLIEYPDVDIHHLPFPDGSRDLIVHSDTLEHVADPLGALTECRRVLAPHGAVCFSIPVIPSRLTRRRDHLPPSFHGSESDAAYLVFTEYGADFWAQILDSGFTALNIYALQWPDAIGLVASA